MKTWKRQYTQTWSNWKQMLSLHIRDDSGGSTDSILVAVLSHISSTSIPFYSSLPLPLLFNTSLKLFKSDSKNFYNVQLIYILKSAVFFDRLFFPIVTHIWVSFSNKKNRRAFWIGSGFATWISCECQLLWHQKTHHQRRKDAKRRGSYFDKRLWGHRNNG